MRKIVVLALVLVATLLMSCTTTTDGNGGGGLTQYAFDWAYDMAKKFAEDDWSDWDVDTVLIEIICIFADEKCRLGRPEDDSYWGFLFQNGDNELYGVLVDYDGDVDGEEIGETDNIHYQETYSNDKLEEMMTFCLDEDNDYWDMFPSNDPDNFSWWVYIFYADSIDAYVFEVDFYNDDLELWGYIIIDTDGDGDDYDIVGYYLLPNEGPLARGSLYEPASTWVER